MRVPAEKIDFCEIAFLRKCRVWAAGVWRERGLGLGLGRVQVVCGVKCEDSGVVGRCVSRGDCANGCGEECGAERVCCGASI